MAGRTRYKVLIPMAMAATGRASRDATHVSLEIYYAKGGINYTTYKTDPRGYYAVLRPVTVEATPGAGYSSESFMMFDDNAVRVLLRPVARLNAKVLATLADTVMLYAETIAAALAGGNKAGAVDILMAAGG